MSISYSSLSSAPPREAFRHRCSRIRGAACHDFCRDVGLMMLTRRLGIMCASETGYSTAPDVFQLSGSLSGSACCNAAFIFRNQLLLRESIRRSLSDDRRPYIGSCPQIAKRVRLKANGIPWRIWQSYRPAAGAYSGGTFHDLCSCGKDRPACIPQPTHIVRLYLCDP